MAQKHIDIDINCFEDLRLGGLDLKKKLNDVELWKDPVTGEYFFRIEYICRNKCGTYKEIFPKVRTGIPIDHNNIHYGELLITDECKKLDSFVKKYDEFMIHTGDTGGLEILSDGNGRTSYKVIVYGDDQNKGGFTMENINKRYEIVAGEMTIASNLTMDALLGLLKGYLPSMSGKPIELIVREMDKTEEVVITNGRGQRYKAPGLDK